MTPITGHAKRPPGRSRAPNRPLFWRWGRVLCAGVAQSFRKRTDFPPFSPFFPSRSSPSSRRRRLRRTRGLKQENARSQAGERAVSSRRGPQAGLRSPTTRCARERGRAGIARRRLGGIRIDWVPHPLHRLRRARAPRSWSSTRTATGWPRAAREKLARVSLLAAPMLEQIERVSTACWASRRFSAPRVAFDGQSTHMGDAEETEAPLVETLVIEDGALSPSTFARSAPTARRSAQCAARLCAACESKVDDLGKESAQQGKRSKESAARKAREDESTKPDQTRPDQTRPDQPAASKHEIWFW